MARKRVHPVPVIAAIAGITAGVYFARTPWILAQEQDKDLKRMESELEKFTAEEVKERQKEELKNPVKREESARRMGMFPEDELPLK